jgi:hypothetical protein
MAIQFAALTRDAMLNAIETEIGATAHLKLRTGAAPANVAAADSGTVLCDMTLPADYFQASSAGAMAKSAAAWTGTASGGGGSVAHWRMYTSGGTAKMQGTLTATGGGGDMTIDNVVLADGQTVTVTGFTLTAPGA